jgi:Predicted transmembrane transcriptional regulator (anti-sigma factor)
MKCTEIQKWLWEYEDLPEHDIRRLQVREHVKICPACREEFRLWQESVDWIRESAADGPVPAKRISDTVMRRIYEQESWRVPVVQRAPGISDRTRKWAAGLMSFFLALFFISLFHSLVTKSEEPVDAWYSRLPAASADSQLASADSWGDMWLEGIPVASISDPILVRMDTLQTDPNYWLVFSLLGIVSMLLIMNWLSRVRS